MNVLEREMYLHDPAWTEARNFFRAETGDYSYWPLWTPGDSKAEKVEAQIDRDASELAENITRGDDASLLALLGFSISILFMRYYQQDSLEVWFAPYKGQENSFPLLFKKSDGTFAEGLVETRKKLLRGISLSAFPARLLLDDANSYPDILCSLSGFQEISGDLAGKATVSVIMTRGSDRSLGLEIVYSPESLPAVLVQNMPAHLSELWRLVCSNPEGTGQDPDFIPGDEKSVILKTASRMGDTSDWGFPDKSIPELFSEIAARFPERPAVVSGDLTLSYAGLMKKTLAIAKSIIDEGFQEGAPIAVLGERSPDTIAAIMGILFSGHHYVPIDPLHPLERKLYIAKDSGIVAILSSGTAGTDIDEITARLDNVRSLYTSSIDDADNIAPVLPHIDPSCTAYIIYTSGTTGNPKGSIVTHRNVARLIRPDTQLFDFTEKDVWSLFHSFCFDFSVWEIFGPLLFGSCVAIASEEERRDPQRFLATLQKNGVSILSQTPTAFYQLANTAIASGVPLPALRTIVFGGEVLKVRLLEQFAKTYPHVKLVNMYGITETTVHVTFKELALSDILEGSASVGTAIPTLRVYLLDRNLRVQPRGAIGEICVEGLGLADGYLNRPEQTREKFVINPHSGERIYRSGDLGRWNADNEIEIIGRNDAQLKINGYRVEPSEIEFAMTRHSMVTAAACAARADKSGLLTLYGWYCASADISVSEMREFLLKYLPAYMVPSRMMQMDSFPLNASGKIDYKALPDPGDNIMHKGPRPSDELELLIASAWEDVLGVKEPGINDSFYELGGDSIKAMQIVARLAEADLTIDIKDMFKNPTIAGLKPFVRKLSRTAPQEAASGSSGLSPIQEYFFAFADEGLGWYNQAVSLFLPGGFERPALAKALEAVFERHDALRLAFYRNDTGWESAYQQRSMQEIDVFPEIADEGDIAAIAGSRLYEDFDLSDSTLFRVGLIPARDGEYLILAAHHLVIDTVSWQVIIEDLSSTYFRLINNEPVKFPLRTDSYASWVDWLKGPALADAQADRKYWADTVSAPGPFFIGKTRGKNENAISGGFSLAEGETAKLMSEAWKAYYCDPRDILIAALGVALDIFFDSRLITIELEGHGRETPMEVLNVSRTVGWFTSIYPIQIPCASSDYADAIKTSKENLRKVPSNGQSYGILKYLGRDESLQKPAADILFNFHGEVDWQDRNSGLRVVSQDTGLLRSPKLALTHGLEINLMVSGGVLSANIIWDSSILESGQVGKFIERYKLVIQEMIEHCMSIPEPVHTPSDFGLQEDMDENDMEALLQAVKDL